MHLKHTEADSPERWSYDTKPRSVDKASSSNDYNHSRRLDIGSEMIMILAILSHTATAVLFIGED